MGVAPEKKPLALSSEGAILIGSPAGGESRVADSLDHVRTRATPPAEAWTEHGIEPVGSAERLTPDQPESGLLWVVEGSVTVSRQGRAHEITRGSVAAYRLGGGLTWSVGEGTHVRWSRRAVRLEAGHVAPWTADLALDVPAGTISPDRPHRKMYAMMAIALSWVVALTVAWCYDQAHSASLSPTAGLVGALPPLTQEQLKLSDDVVSAFGALGFDATQPFFPGGKSSKLNVRVRVHREDADWQTRIAAVAHAQFDKNPALLTLLLRLSDDGNSDCGNAIFRRGKSEPEVKMYREFGGDCHPPAGAGPASGVPLLPTGDGR